jgi:hypothetical protein
MRKLFAVLLLVTLPLAANEVSYHSLQSGWTGSATPLFDHGIHGEGQIIAVLDTGLDYDNCFFAEADGSAPPMNTGTPSGGFGWTNINPARRKVIAYDFLYSCAQFPGMPDCENPSDPMAYDNQGHGTHAAASATGDRGTPIVHDYGDAIAPGAKLVVQDAGVSFTDACTSRPGIGCPVNLTPILDQAYKQGVRIHSNSWGDHGAPTASYSQAARDLDAFVYAHPDMLVVFNTGNLTSNGWAPPNSLSSPGCAKNSIQVGGTRQDYRDDSVLASYSLVGPARDGRIKPDLVGPSFVLAGDTDGDINSNKCDISFQPGTSWASPTIAGAAALVRQYYTDGYYPSGYPTPSDRFTPTAALLKATMIAAARAVPLRAMQNGPDADAGPVPSPVQGWGFPVLDDALYFPGDKSRSKVVEGEVALGQTSTLHLQVNAGTPLKAVLVWTDPPGAVSTGTAPNLVNDLDLRIGSLPSQADHINNVEVISIASPTSGNYAIDVTASRLGFGSKQSYALVVTGDISDAPSPRVRAVRH